MAHRPEVLIVKGSSLKILGATTPKNAPHLQPIFPMINATSLIPNFIRQGPANIFWPLLNRLVGSVGHASRQFQTGKPSGTVECQLKNLESAEIVHREFDMPSRH
jgi:hypothetical protein